MSIDTNWISSARYVADEEGVNECVVVMHTNGFYLSVPMHTSNRHYEAVLAWVAEGNTIADAD